MRDKTCCGHCQFWWNLHSKSGLGRCHRYAPSYPTVTTNPDGLVSPWPETGEEEWCGDFRSGQWAGRE